MSASGLPFDDIRTLAQMLPPPDADAMAAVTAHNRNLAKPVGSLGRVEELAVWLAGWQGNPRPAITRPLLAIFAGNHGVTAQGVSPWPQGMTSEIVANYAAGGAAANQICAVGDVGLKVFELALPVATRDISREPAMDEKECAATIAFGMEAIAGGADLLCLGGFGIGNHTIAAAMLTALLGGAPEDWLVEQGDARRNGLAAINTALALHGRSLDDPLEVLRRLGGREFAAIAGAILAARLQRIPVVLSGIVTLAAAAVLERLGPNALDHCTAGHASPAPAHGKALAALGLTPVLSTEIALEDGAGAALAVPHLRAAAACNADMATAEQAGLSGKLH
jgi:nicotinate-nucleotide--dimethylbenzimidazole phosphoribosyltransferase